MHKYVLLLGILLASCSPETSKDVTLLDPSLQTILSPQASIEYLTEKIYSVSEGPAWSTEHMGLLFTDVQSNKMYLWQEGKGVRLFLDPSGYTAYAPTFEKGQNGANGLLIQEGRLIICQHGDRRVAVVTSIEGTTPSFQTLVDTFDGKRFNSPNDLIQSKEGDLYFTDPPYGLFNKETQAFDETLYRELHFNGVYRYRLGGEVTLITKELTRPNGIALSLDENYLYVNNSDKDRPVMMRYEVNNNWAPSVFFDGSALSEKYEGSFDGMKVHSSGHIFTTGPNGILILSPEGTLKGTINFGGRITNCAFDPTEDYLYVTTFSQVARIKLQPNK